MKHMEESKKISLRREPEFLMITDGNSRYYGGDQDWFSFTVGKYGGCGTVAAANLTAYLATQNPELSGLYMDGNFEKHQFVKHMEAVYDYVRPWKIPLVSNNARPWKRFGWTLGLWPANRLAKGLRRYGASRGIQLQPIEISCRHPAKEVVSFVADSLSRDCPVAMLVGNQPRFEQEVVTRPDGVCWHQTHFARHWVLITALEENRGQLRVKVSTWGGCTWLDLNAWCLAGQWISGLVSLTW